MSVATARRSSRRLARAVAAVAVVAAPLCSTVARADPTPTPSSAPVLPVAVDLRGISPLAPQADQTLTIRGRLTNTGSEDVADLQPQLRVSPSRIGSRGQFDDIAGTPDGPLPDDAAAVSTAEVHVGRTSLTPGTSTSFTISVPMSDVHLPESWQVYEMGVTVSGTTALGVDTVGQLRTFLPWAPVGQPGTGAPTPVAWVWPLVDRPHRVTASSWTDDNLAPELRPGGRLDVLLSAAAAAETQHAPAPRRQPRKHKHRKVPPPPPRPAISPVPVTWAVDPMLLEDVQAMTAGYTIGSGKDGTRGTGQAAARSWLSSLRSATTHGAVLGLPYGDPDLVAAVRAGLAGQAQHAFAVGQKQLSRELSGTALDYAWPPGGFTDRRTLDTLADSGVTTFVLDDSALPVVSGDQSLTPGAHAKVVTHDGSMDAVLVDDRLSSAVDAAAADPALTALTTQRVLSELLMIQAEHPSLPRSVVIAPDRRWSPTPQLATALLSGSGRVPWVQPLTLDQVVSAPVYSLVQRGTVINYPPTARSAELPRPYLRSTVPLGRRLDAFAAILLGDPQAGPFDEGLLRLLSSAWRTDPAGADTRRGQLDAAIRHTMQRVSITTQPDSLITLTGSSGTVPITVSNELDTPVQVAISAAADPHLEVRRGAHVTRTIRPHTQVPVDVRVTALSRGVATLTVSLSTPGPDSRPYGPPVLLRVNSTAYGLEALLITGGATAVLFVGAGVRLVRRARASRRAARAGA